MPARGRLDPRGQREVWASRPSVSAGASPAAEALGSLKTVTLCAHCLRAVLAGIASGKRMPQQERSLQALCGGSQPSTSRRGFPKRMSGNLTDRHPGPGSVFSEDPLHTGVKPFLFPILPHRLARWEGRARSFVGLHPCPPGSPWHSGPVSCTCPPLGVSDQVSRVWGLPLRLVSCVCLARAPEHCIPFWVLCFWLLPLCIGAFALRVKMLVFYRHNPCETILIEYFPNIQLLFSFLAYWVMCRLFVTG